MYSATEFNNIAVKMITVESKPETVSAKTEHCKLQEVWLYQTVLLSKCIFAFTPVMR